MHELRRKREKGAYWEKIMYVKIQTVYRSLIGFNESDNLLNHLKQWIICFNVLSHHLYYGHVCFDMFWFSLLMHCVTPPHSRMLIWATRGLKSGESSKNKLKLRHWSLKYCIDDVNCNQGLPSALSIYLQHLFTAESRFTLITCDRCESVWRHWGERYPACYILQRLAAGPFGFRMRSSEPLWNHMLVQRALGSSWCITTLSRMWLECLCSSWMVLLMLLNKKFTEVGSHTLIFHRDDSEPSHQIVNDLIFH